MNVERSTSEDYRRPDGVAGPFAPRPDDEAVPYTPPPRTAPPRDIAAAYGRSAPDGRAFDPPPSHRVAPRHGTSGPPVHPGDAGAFGAPPDARDGYDPAPGDRIGPRRATSSPWWVEGAEHDPWRDPASPSFLGRPAVFVDGRPSSAEGDLEDADENTEDVPPADRRVVRGRFGASAVVLAVLIALLAGALGGGTGYLLSERAHGILTDSGVTLGTSGQPANRPPGSVARIAQRVLPAVVSIEVRTSNQVGTGSGVVVSKVSDGSYVLTNNHVVSAAAAGGGDAGTIRVTFSDGATTAASIVGRDTLTDLAVVKVARTDVTVASLGDSGSLAVGDPVIAIGSPLGLQGSVTSGIVSALHRPVHVSGEGTDTNAVIDAIQTDAAINPGNSGGALVDAAGSVVGVNSAIASLATSGAGSIGVGFAIPVDVARTVAQELIRTGRAVHSTLGLSARSVTDGTRDGAYVLQVVPNGPAAVAGLKEGDVVVHVGTLAIGSSDELTVAVQQRDPGAQVPVTFYRGSAQQTVTVTLGTA